MKKFSILFALLVTVTGSFAQTGPGKRSTFHFSFAPPLSTSGRYAAEYTNTVSLSMLAGLSENEEAFSLAGLANIVMNDANGFQLSGLLNYAGNSGRGFMLSGLANVVHNNYRGFQLTGLGNIASSMEGFQLAGLGNIAGDMKGFQLAGLGNIAGDVRGFQLSGLFNYAKNVSGVQFAGLFNIAETSDCPIALLNIIKNGEYSVAATYNEAGSAVLTFRSGGLVTYGILGVGYNHKSNDKGFVTEGGLGAHINIAHWLRVNNEIKAGSIGDFSDSSTFYANYALLPAFRILHNLELFGGPSVNYMQSDDTGNKNMFPNHSIWKKHSDTKLQQVYVGWQAGVQFLF